MNLAEKHTRTTCAAATMQRAVRVLCLGLGVMFSTALAGCGSKEVVIRVHPTALALEGPALAVAGEYEGKKIHGTMDRKTMGGVGKISLAGLFAENGSNVVCESTIDALPTEKGRVRGILTCSDGRAFSLTLSNLGPDQGMGVAKAENSKNMMLLFYHPSSEEAVRRLEETKQDIAEALRRKAAQEG